MAVNWTEAKVKKLAKLWGKGISAREIAEKLGESITRNAVIGKANRLGLNKDLQPKSNSKVIDDNSDKMFHLKIKGCRWPFGDPGTDEFHFCGAKQELGKPYCLDHCMLAYRKKEVK
ncbi:GcrA family cell cycle regulator [Alphaproteobacteria bacterium]|nr:GcrA family cell cycle regulator [Alphaproteobacteria bacterium]